MDESVSEWLGRLKSGEADAAQKLWDRYAHELVDLARRRLGTTPKSVSDEEDVAQSVFSSVCRGAQAGRFADIKTRDELWWLLLTITKQKAVDLMRRELADKRGAGRVGTEAQLAADSQKHPTFGMDDLAGSAPTPEFLVMLDEQYQRLLGKLRNDRMRQVAISRVEGYTIEEIAGRLSISVRAVERKLQLIRAQWAQDLSDFSPSP
jgi:DNA-directed RNA polymerase specialized sigma24 family protein